MRTTSRFVLAAALALVAAGARATVPTETSSSGPYTCDGSQTAYTVGFRFLDNTHLVVTKTQVSTGAVSALALTTDYTVTGAGAPTGGTVTLVAASRCASGYTLSIKRVATFTQTTAFSSQGAFSPKAIENALDKTTMLAQQLQRDQMDAANAATVAQENSALAASSAAAAAASAAAAQAAVVAASAPGNATPITATGTSTAVTLANRWAREVWVEDEGAVGDGTTDDYAAIASAITKAAGKKLRFTAGKTYRYTQPLTITGVDVDFGGATLLYAGAAGSFALTLNSDSGGGTTGTTGNVFENLTLSQTNYSEYVTYVATTTYDPPSIAASNVISSPSPGGISTTVTVPGATVGGFARASLSTNDWSSAVEITARVTAPDTVTVTFSNYHYAAIDLASGTLSVTVVNNAYHGLALGGSLGRLRNAKVVGFTGVSVGLGNGVDVTSGVTFSGSSRVYYWYIDVNIASAGGWELIIPPRNNENEFSIGTFPANYYNESPPRRANCINQVVLGGVTNKFHRMGLEASASEETFVILSSANLNRATGIPYIEYNTSWVTPPAPRVLAKVLSSGNVFRFRHPYGGKPTDWGIDNELEMGTTYAVNANRFVTPSVSRNLITNGDFENGTTGWVNYTDPVGNSTLAVPGTAGAITGKKMRLDITDARPSVQQSIVTVLPLVAAGLYNQNITVSAVIKTNIGGVCLRLNGTSNACTAGDETEEYLTVTYKAFGSLLDVSVYKSTNATGYIEISNVTAYVGRNGGSVAERTTPVGSKTHNPGSVAGGAQETTTVSVPGASLGDYASCSFSLDLQGMLISGYVNATDTVTCVFHNGTGGALDLASGTLRARVVKY